MLRHAAPSARLLRERTPNGQAQWVIDELATTLITKPASRGHTVVTVLVGKHGAELADDHVLEADAPPRVVDSQVDQKQSQPVPEGRILPEETQSARLLREGRQREVSHAESMEEDIATAMRLAVRALLNIAACHQISARLHASVTLTQIAETNHALLTERFYTRKTGPLSAAAERLAREIAERADEGAG